MNKPVDEIVLHIGGEKTGTTSLQNFLFRNRELLKSCGVLFPISPGIENHILLAVYSSPTKHTDDLRASADLNSPQKLNRLSKELPTKLKEEISKSGCRLVLLSNEHCSSRLQEDGALARLCSLILPLARNLRILMYVRRQDELLLSTYSTSVKSGDVRPLRIPKEGEYHLFDYAKLLDRWGRIFGESNITVRVYEPELLVDGDIVADFMHTTALPVSKDEVVRPDARLNKSLDVRLLEFLRLFNKHVPYISDETINPERRGLLEILEQLSSSDRVEIDSVQMAEFLKLFQKSNAYVARKYLKREDGVLFPQRTNIKTAGARVLDVPEAVRIAAELWLRRKD